MIFRRVLARIRQRRHADVWPICEAAGKRPEGWPGWPDGKKFALVLTHDVEGLKGLVRCRELMALEKNLGFRASFNFIPEGDYRVSRELREELEQNGFEVGVHDLHHDGKLYREQAEFAEKASHINRYLREWGASGFRAGFMYHHLEWAHELDIKYDASTFDSDPFEPQPDGVGTIFPFWVPRAGGGGYVELPYTLPQDFTMFVLLKEHGPKTWKQKLEWIVKQGGMALLDVHPDYMDFAGDRAKGSEYPVRLVWQEFLKHIADRYPGMYWNPLPRDLAAWYKKPPVRRNLSPSLLRLRSANGSANGMANGHANGSASSSIVQRSRRNSSKPRPSAFA